MFHVYVLLSISTHRLYIGHTNNLERRLKEHNRNKSKSTKNQGPWELIGSKKFETRSEAMKLEKKLKSFKNPERVLSYMQK